MIRVNRWRGCLLMASVGSGVGKVARRGAMDYTASMSIACNQIRFPAASRLPLALGRLLLSCP